MSGWRNRASGYIMITPPACAGPAAAGGLPSRAAVLVISRGSPEGSAAMTSSSFWVLAGKARIWRRKCASSRRLSGSGPGSGPAPDSSAAVSSPASSMIAIGHPCISVTIRLASWGSSGPSTDDPSSSRASCSGRPPTRMPGMPSSSTRPSAPSRVPNSSAIRSACTRRPTMARTSRDSWSSHCASSTTQSSGKPAAASARRESAARPAPKRSAGVPSIRPKAQPSALRCRCGNPAIAGRKETSSLCSPA